VKVNLDGQVAIVTGAARGIGQAISDAFAQNGATVIYTDVDSEELQKTARLHGGVAMTMDVTKESQIDATLDRVLDEYGRLDITVNNAGVNTLQHRVTIDEFPKEEWDRILDVNLNGLFLVSKASARYMKQQKSGRIINISSVAGLVPLRLQCAFVAAKAAVANLTRAMALELAPDGILVNAVAPGSTLTEGTKRLFYGEDGASSENVRRLLDHIPLGRPAHVEEIAQAVLFLSDPANSYMTGQVLVVDGGWTAGGYVRDF
jgi:NAD(P)-dependent dehydrogenase (short-subunit alcohol dehydrogenase family)